MNCKKCKHYHGGERSECDLLKTHTAELKKPDLGQKLRGCKFEKKEDPDGLQA